MKGFLLICALLSASCLSVLAVSPDSTALAELDGRLEAYFRTLEAEGAEIKNRECDLLIGNARTSELKQHIALKVYAYYLNSPLMGDEAVAVHVADTWFLSGKVQMHSETDLLNAKLFAAFNRQSLIGCKAPPVLLYDPAGNRVDPGKDASRARVLYFYDTDCARCKLETLRLERLFAEKDYPVDFQAVYAGANEDSWEEWRKSHFGKTGENPTVVHLWDPEVSSGFQEKYGVLETPGMFLIDPYGVIVGRRLDAEALERLLDHYLAEWDYVYGREESVAVFDRIFAAFGDSLQAGSVIEVASLLQDRIGKDTLAYKHLEGDLLYYLSTRREEALREGMLPFLDTFILSRPEIWNLPDDTLKVVGMAGMMKSLLSKAQPGSRLPLLRLPGWKKFRRRGGYLFFHTEGCEVCREQLAGIDAVRRNVPHAPRVFTVDVDKVSEASPELAGQLFDAFDLSVFPLGMEIGRRGVVLRRYISVSENIARFSRK